MAARDNNAAVKNEYYQTTPQKLYIDKLNDDLEKLEQQQKAADKPRQVSTPKNF